MKTKKMKNTEHNAIFKPGFPSIGNAQIYLACHDLETETSAIDRLYDKYGRIAGLLTSSIE